MSELQTEESEIIDNEAAEAETLNEGADLATDSAEEREEKDPAKVAQEQAQKAINKQHAKYREEERKRIEAEKKAQELEERLSKLEASDEIVIPPLPDAWDEDYDERMAARDKAIAEQARLDAQKSVQQKELDSAKEAAERAERERMNELVVNYDKRIVTLGLSPSEIEEAAKTVIDYGISQDVAEFILQHEKGPLITKYLATNPLELDDLRSMSPIQAALTIERKISPAADTLKPQATAAPDPVESLGSRGVGEKESPLIKGATFE